MIYREQILGLGKPAAPRRCKPWVLVTWAKALPGKGSALKAAWEKYRKPLYDQLLADGTISGYGFGVEELKSTGEFTHMTWVSMADLGAREKVRAALDALPETERDAAMSAFLAAMDPDALRSNLFKSEMFAAAPPR